jgi:hypothetical protein
MIMSSRRKLQDLKTEGKIFAGVSSFKYLGNVINNGIIDDNCVKERIQTESRAYFANICILRSKIISRAPKIQAHKALIRSVAS